MVDDNGYLVIHPSLLDTPEDDVHISTREEFITDQLIEKNVMKPAGCIDYSTLRNYTYWKVGLHIRKIQLLALDMLLC